MAQTSTTAKDFIKSIFSPHIAILCSEEAECLCMKSNLKFVEMLQPFSKITSEVNISDPSGSLINISKFQIKFQDMMSRPPQPILSKRILNEAVSSSSWMEKSSKSVISWANGTNIELSIQPSTQWFEEWRDIFLQIQHPSDHEFTKHFLACIIVVSAGSANLMDQINKLSQYQHQLQHQNTDRFPKWFCPNILKCYLILHDVQEVSNESAQESLKQMKSSYGAINCHLLTINSGNSNSSDSSIAALWTGVLKQKRIIDGNNFVTQNNSELSSGTESPRADVDFPSHVTEGNTSESPEESFAHPLSPLSSPSEDKNGIVDGVPLESPYVNHDFTVNSATFNQVPFGAVLTSTDVDRIKGFVENFCLKSLIPYAERQIRYLNDVLINRSRSKSLLSATRRWLGGTKPPSGNSNSVIYSQEATELQTRRLGDLCFMFGLYDLAYNSYYTAKNDFKSDQAWLYFAGAQEMASLSLFMQGASDYQRRYLESSLHTYLNVCKVYNFAIRNTLLTTEILKHNGEYGETALMFIKMTSEESDLLSALMLEQAAHCFINSKKPLARKYAFHMTLAGHRFSKSSQRAHSLRSYKEAFQVYYKRGWILAEDHIHYTMGKQAFQLKLCQESLDATKRLVNRDYLSSYGTKSNPLQQLIYMREFLNILAKCSQEQLPQSSEELFSICVPVLFNQEVKIVVGNTVEKSGRSEWLPATHVSFNDDDSREKRWYALEKECLVLAQGNVMLFHPNLLRLSASTPNKVPPKVPIRENVFIELKMRNPLLISLRLSDIKPVCDCFTEDGAVVNDDSFIQCEATPSFTISPESDYIVNIAFRPQKLGRILIKGISYKLSLTSDSNSESQGQSVQIQQKIQVKGQRLNSTLSERSNLVYAKDERLNIIVISAMPQLSVMFKELPSVLTCGEIKHFDVQMRNAGDNPLTNLIVCVSDPKHIILSIKEHDTHSSDDISNELMKIESSFSVPSEANIEGTSRARKLKLPHNGVLNPRENLSASLWLFAPSIPGTFDVEIIFYYESTNPLLKSKYRLLRHLSSVYVYPSVSVDVTCSESVSLSSTRDGDSTSHAANLVLRLINKSEGDNNSGKVEPVGIGVNSSSYGIVPHSLKDITTLDAHQRCQFVFKCRHSKEKPDKSLRSSYLPIQQNVVFPSHWLIFSVRERLKLPEISLDSAPNSYNIGSTKKNQNADQQIIDDLKMDLVATVLWRAKRGDEDVFGLHNSYIESIDAKQDAKSSNEMLAENPPVKFFIENDDSVSIASTVSPAISEQRSIVKVNLDLPSEVGHKFSSNPLCRVQYGITFYNSSSCPHIIEAKFLTVQSSQYMLPVGKSCRQFLLNGFQSQTIPCVSIVSASGTYFVGSIQIRIRRAESPQSDWISQDCQVSSVVLVKDERETSVR